MQKQVASVSGGRTSHYMIHALLEKFSRENVDFVFCDTGAEHKNTYEFIRKTEEHFNIHIQCIRLFMPKPEGEGGEYIKLTSEQIGLNYKAFNSLMEKYGRPYVPSGKFCTNQMKTNIYKKYCNDTYGEGNYTTWIGYRSDPKDSSRAWGQSLSGTLTRWFNIPQVDQGDFYKNCNLKLEVSIGTLIDYIAENKLNPTSQSEWRKIMKIVDRVMKNKQIGYRFLFEISDFEEEDILKWWGSQEFDLDIPNHCGNCVFCIEKSVNQLSYLCHTQPEYASEWVIQLDSNKIPNKDRLLGEKVMYRDGAAKLTFEEIRNNALSKPKEYWEARVYRETKSNPCAQNSCESYTVD